MGGLVFDSTALSILVQVNARFGAGAPIEELVGLQKEFKIFTSKHQLRDSFALLNIAPPPGRERERWYKYLEQLRKFSSDKSRVNGHDRIVQAIEKNLESTKPLPMRLIVHSVKQSREVRVAVEAPIVFSKQKYLVVSVPTASSSLERKK